MATCKINKIPPPPPPPPQLDIELHLTMEEAKTLFDITKYISGDPISSRRKFSDNIQCVLRTALNLYKDQECDDIIGNIDFKKFK